MFKDDSVDLSVCVSNVSVPCGDSGTRKEKEMESDSVERC